MSHATSQAMFAETKPAQTTRAAEAAQAARAAEAAQAARNAMVDSQVRPNKVTDARLIAAMREIPREAFLPASLHARAYADDDVRLGAGRVMVSPMITARLLQLAAPRDGERALLVGSGTGYTAVLLAACGAAVTALEDDAALIAIAGPALAAWSPSVVQVTGPLAAGWPEAAPYDLVVIEGAVGQLPEAIGTQLAPQGRLVMVRSAGTLGQAVLGRHSGGQISFVVAFDAAVTSLPAFRRAPGFAF
jgi:protein-L-isoaspartate(D-aspartate) O-methyltransferase